MKILVTGSGGMIGRKLVERLVQDKTLGGKPIESLTLVDVVDSPIPTGAPRSPARPRRNRRSCVAPLCAAERNQPRKI